MISFVIESSASVNKNGPDKRGEAPGPSDMLELRKPGFKSLLSY